MLMERDGALGGWRALPVWKINAVITPNIPGKRIIARIRVVKGRTATGTINSSAQGGVIARIMIII
jgi:hypothetical protein